MVKVSVIIPMYNTESYIMQCIESVTRQTYSDLEILVIDDGSTDRSLEICKALTLYDNRIRIFKQENKGVSSARNKGLEKAAGKYIFSWTVMMLYILTYWRNMSCMQKKIR